MMSRLERRFGKYLPKPIKSHLYPLFYILKESERYVNYKINDIKSDVVVETEYEFKMSVDTSDYVQRRYVTDEGSAEKELAKFFHQKVIESEGDFVDVGANVGFYSLIFARHSDGTVFAFEPLSDNVEKFKENMSINRLNNFEIFFKGLAERQYTSELQYRAYNKGGGGELPPGEGVDFWLTSGKVDFWITSQDVAFERLDDVKRISDDVAIIKIDVEGHELDVLRGAERTIRNQHPSILIEIHPERLRQKGQSVEELLEYVFYLGYNSVYLVQDETEFSQAAALESLETVKECHGLWFEGA